jgi:hypothetical protein
MTLTTYLFEDDEYVASDFRGALDNCNRDYRTKSIEMLFVQPICIKDDQTFTAQIKQIDELLSTPANDFVLFFDLDLTLSGLTSTMFEKCVSRANGDLAAIRKHMIQNRISSKNLETGFWLLERAKGNLNWRGIISVVSGVASNESIESMLESLGCKSEKRICAFASNGSFKHSKTREAKLREAIDKYLVAFGSHKDRLHPQHANAWF